MENNKVDKIVVILIILAVIQFVLIISLFIYVSIVNERDQAYFYCSSAFCEESSCVRDGDKIICSECVVHGGLEDGTDWIGTCTYQYIEKNN